MPLSSKKNLSYFFKQLPNGLSLLRLLCGPIVFLTLLKKHYLTSTFLFCAGILTDFIDGHIARYFRVTSKMGSILDPLADKVFVSLTAYGLFLLDAIPLWFFLALIARDVVVLLGAAISFLRPEQHPQPLPHAWGKFSLACQALSLFLGFMNLFYHSISPSLMYSVFVVTLVTMIFSLSIYTARFVRYGFYEK